MKNLIKFGSGLLMATALVFASCSKDENDPPPNYGNININLLLSQVNSLPKQALSQAEIDGLLYMREEEKLARDVYITLYNKWGSNIFNNIINSEQTHMDAVLILLNRYNLTDPVGSNGVGVFTNSDLQDLYDDLIAMGNISVLKAYQVGATIEDLDLYDLYDLLEIVDNQDITLVFENLAKGSRNHLRSFYSNILNVGGTYTPQFLTQAEFDAIINSPMETGF